MTTCNSCGAKYNETQPDSSPYFHACAPVKNPAFQPDSTKANLNTVETIERANKRDENLIFNAIGEITGIKSAGAGVTKT